MLTNPFVPAKKEKIYLRMALVGASGSGKTYTALTIASQLAGLCDGKIAFIDTEGRSARKYADKFTFDVLDLSKNYSPQEYINAVNAAVQHGYAVIVVDSFSHAWNGTGGVLDIVDKAGQKMGGNKFAGWATGRPAQNALANTVLTAPIHIIGTMRSKTEWLIQPDPKTGKDKPVKVGLAPVQSDDFEYEFDVVAYMDMQHALTITKTRCSDLDGLENANDVEFVSGTLHAWLTDGTPPDKPDALAKNYLATEDGKKAFYDFWGKLAITDNAPYLAALGNLTRYSDYTGTYDDLCKEIQTIHDKLNAPPEDEQPDEPQSEAQPVLDLLSTDDVRDALNHKPGRIETNGHTPPAIPDQSPDAMQSVADTPVSGAAPTSDATFPPANGGGETLAQIAAQPNGTPVVTDKNSSFMNAGKFQKPMTFPQSNPRPVKDILKDMQLTSTEALDAANRELENL